MANLPPTFEFDMVDGVCCDTGMCCFSRPFRFPTATPGRLFFPTVHIHDGKVHETEEFDHTLYAQAWRNAVIKGREWEESAKNAGQFVKLEKAKGLVWSGGHLYKKNIIGLAKNQDTIAETRRLG